VKQVHGARAVLAAEATASNLAGEALEADAVVARGSDGAVAVGVRVADCVPVLVADRATGAVAAGHSGRTTATVPFSIATKSGPVKMLGTYTAIPETGWGVIVQIEERKAYYDAENKAVDLINGDFYRYAHHVTAHAKGALQPRELSRAFVRYKHVDYYDPALFGRAYDWMKAHGMTEGHSQHAALVGWKQSFQWTTGALQNLVDLVSARPKWPPAADIIGVVSFVFLVGVGAVFVARAIRHRDIPLTWWVYALGGSLAPRSRAANRGAHQGFI